MSSSITPSEFAQRVLRRLNEAASSPIGELTTGSGGASPLTTAQAIADYASEGSRSSAVPAGPCAARSP